MPGLTERWYPLIYHPEQARVWNSTARFDVVVAGRRSGKTEIPGKRRLVKRAMAARRKDARFFAAAPTRDQAKALYWDDLKELVPGWAMAGRPKETELTIQLVHGPRIVVVGLDKPQRIEGRPWDGGVVDEYADVKPDAWMANIRPALSDRGGWCTFMGVPEGRNHFYELYRDARAGKPGWAAYHWTSAEILDVLRPSEIASAMEDMDEDIFAQEYEASFISFRGRAYRQFDEKVHCAPVFRLYRPDRPLVFCFDFNVEPGAAVVCQEVKLPSGHVGTAVIGEVHIPYDSDTPSVCRRLVADWQGHDAPIYVYGDATGGNRGSANVLGPDWDIVKGYLKDEFGTRVRFRVPPSNVPKAVERARINSINARLRAKSGAVRMMVDPNEAPQTVLDLEGVRLLEGGSGEINKSKDPKRTHWSDALGYYLAMKYPVRGAGPAKDVRLTFGG